MAKRTALVIGAGGFTGRHVFQRLLGSREWTPVSAREHAVDILDPDTLRRAVDRVKPDAIINLAAIATLDQNNIPLIYQMNGMAIVEILAMLARIGFQGRFVNASSSLVYGSRTPESIRETQLLLPEHHYAIAKAMADRCCLNYRDVLDVVVARPFNCIGRGHKPDFVVPKIVSHFRERRSTIELGGTTNRRDFVDVRDVAGMYEAVISCARPPPIVNFCSGTASSIEDIIATLTDITGHRIEVSHNPAFMRSVDSPFMCGDNRQLLALPFTYQYLLRDTLAWMLDDK